jgi:hypothetical protein
MRRVLEWWRQQDEGWRTEMFYWVTILWVILCGYVLVFYATQ